MKGSLLPGVGETHDQNKDENHYLYKHVQTHSLGYVFVVDRRPRIEKRRLDVEDKEKQREGVVADGERPPWIGNGSLSSLVDLALHPRTPPAGRDKPRQNQRCRNKSNYQ